jgi:hypothetical protein
LFGQSVQVGGGEDGTTVIIGSILLILVAAALFAVGLYGDSGSFYYSSIVISVLAAFALMSGLRQTRVRLAFGDDFDLGRDASGQPGATLVGAPWSEPQAVAGDVPPDEPAQEILNAADLIALARLSVPVTVVDGRPRYHLPECLHLLGRQIEPLPVREAIQAGFTSCGQCQPATWLVACRSTEW